MIILVTFRPKLQAKQQAKTQASKGAASEPAVPRHKEKLQPKKIVEDKVNIYYTAKLVM